MAIPRATTDRVAYAQFATRGVLTRLALMFQASPDKVFTGGQVAEILVGAVTAVGRPGERDAALAESNPEAIAAIAQESEGQP